MPRGKRRSSATAAATAAIATAAATAAVAAATTRTPRDDVDYATDGVVSGLKPIDLSKIKTLVFTAHTGRVAIRRDDIAISSHVECVLDGDKLLFQSIQRRLGSYGTVNEESEHCIHDYADIPADLSIVTANELPWYDLRMAGACALAIQRDVASPVFVLVRGETSATFYNSVENESFKVVAYDSGRVDVRKTCITKTAKIAARDKAQINFADLQWGDLSAEKTECGALFGVMPTADYEHQPSECW